jgi:hypothetical protein
VYQWEDVYTAADHDINQEIMAMRFSGTEPLKKPIPYTEVRVELKAIGANFTIVGPVAVSFPAQPPEESPVTPMRSLPIGCRERRHIRQPALGANRSPHALAITLVKPPIQELADLPLMACHSAA